MNMKELFKDDVFIENNVILKDRDCLHKKESNQEQVGDSYSFQWDWVGNSPDREKAHKHQRDWYLKLYGFDSEEDLSSFLSAKKIILDAGCGLGYKAAWFAQLAPESIVIGMDYSNSIQAAAKQYSEYKNLYFIQGDIASTGLKDNVVDYVSCDQVIMHTEIPEDTFRHLSEITNREGEFACYVYAKKALPRELLDEYFRGATKNIDRDDILNMSKQLTELGKKLSELKIELDFPDIPLLGISGGKQDLQRFIYWNFIKCYWNEELGRDISDSTNFDWYSPSNAKRYSEEEYKTMVNDNKLKIEFFHKEEACYSGRFSK